MAREAILVQFVGLEEAYASPYAQSIRRIVCEHQSDYYHFLDVDASNGTHGTVPDIAIVAVSRGQSWTDVRANVNRCRTVNIGLLGAERPVLGLPVIRLLRDITELAHSARYPEELQTVPGSLSVVADPARQVAVPF